MKKALILLSVLAAPVAGVVALEIGGLTGFKQLWQILLFVWPASICGQKNNK